MATFVAHGGQTAFALNISNALFIDSRRIKVTNVRKGSVIIDYQILDTGKDDLEQLN